MKYDNITEAVFLDRPNRFIARVKINDKTETVHVKNTGRCKELLIPGCKVYLTAPGTPGRKTKYDLVAVKKHTGKLFNIDSQAPNKVMGEWLRKQSFDRVIPEYTYGSSRLDFYLERQTFDGAAEKYLIEVKGCTLEIDGVGYFPDAPTERGVKHLKELTEAVKSGYKACIAFVIQTPGVSIVKPNKATHPEFAAALEEAEKAGVGILYLTCTVEKDELAIDSDLYL